MGNKERKMTTNEITSRIIDFADLYIGEYPPEESSEDLGDLLYGREDAFFRDSEEYYSDVDNVFFDESTGTYRIEVAVSHYTDRDTHYEYYCNDPYIEGYEEF